MVLKSLRIQAREVLVEYCVRVACILEELLEVLHVINTREDLFEIAKTELFLLKINDNLDIFITQVCI